MRAEKALAQSPDGLIMADTSPGLVTIYHERGEGIEPSDSFNVSFVPRDTEGRLSGAGTVEVGSYDDLDIALTIAALSYGACDALWMPTSATELARLQPPVMRSTLKGVATVSMMNKGRGD